MDFRRDRVQLIVPSLQVLPSHGKKEKRGKKRKGKKKKKKEKEKKRRHKVLGFKSLTRYRI